MRIASLLLLAFVAQAQAQSPTSSSHPSVITGCHNHGADTFCIDGDGQEVQVSLTATPTGEPPAQYIGCHSHGSQKYCKDTAGNEVMVMAEASSGHSHEQNHSHESGRNDKVNCHFHAGVEHCVGAGESEDEHSSNKCQSRDRQYDVPLRIGTLFVVLVTSCIGVFAPMLLVKMPFRTVNEFISIIIKQFGTGVIVATAFIHLYTHANLMFTNDCLGELEYEATTSAVVMAGIFLSFLVEYIGHRVILHRSTKTPTSTEEDPQHPQNKGQNGTADNDSDNSQARATALAGLSHNHGSRIDGTQPNTKFSVLVMEAGVIFHSILIGVTLVVAGDSFYKTLLVVIVFHQFFEGLALGARIALVPGRIFPAKVIMAATFAIITPVGMAIGLGVLHSFNGNERSTLIALGTLDAVSAGILVWVAVVDMWARDWVIEGGELTDAGLGKVAVGGVALVAGMALMGLLGKWA